MEGCNALVEHFDGRMEILHWPDEVARRESERAAAQAPATMDETDSGKTKVLEAA